MKDENKTKNQLIRELAKLRKKLSKLETGIDQSTNGSKDRLSALILTCPDGIIITDVNGIITEVSRRTLELHGLKKNEEIIGKSMRELIAPEEWGKVTGNLQRTLKEGVVRNVEYTFIRKDGTTFVGELDGSLVYDSNREPAEILNMIRDISDRKTFEEKMKRRLMDFNLEDGKLYLVKEEEPALAIEAFRDLTILGRRHYVISRTPEIDFRKRSPGTYDFVWMAGIGGKNTLSPKINEIQLYIGDLPNKSVVLVNGLDFLIANNGFPESIQFVQRLREITLISAHIIIFNLDPSFLNEMEMKYLDKETNSIDPRFKDLLTDKFLNILKFIHKQDAKGENTSYGDIVRELELSKPTVRKRLDRLKYYGYVKIQKMGIYKVVEITEKGRNLVLK